MTVPRVYETPKMSLMHVADLDGDTDFVVFTNYGIRFPLMVKMGAFGGLQPYAEFS